MSELCDYRSQFGTDCSMTEAEYNVTYSAGDSLRYKAKIPSETVKRRLCANHVAAAGARMLACVPYPQAGVYTNIFNEGTMGTTTINPVAPTRVRLRKRETW